MRTGIYFISALMCAAIVSPLWADSVIVSGGGAWQSGWSPTENDASAGTGGIPFFSRTSSDGPNCNVGFYLTKSALCSSSVHGDVDSGPGKALPYWGTSSGAAVPTFYMQPAVSGKYTITLDLEVAGNYNSNAFGYYLESDPNHTLHQIFAGSDNPVTTKTQVSFTVPSSAYGFYIQDGSTVFYSDSTLNATDKGVQHFALFQGPSTTNDTVFWIGVEDSAGASSDYDYNDMIIKYDAYTPEPVGWVLMATVVAVLGIVTYRHRSSETSAKAA